MHNWLVFNLEIEMAAPPVIEQRMFHVAWCPQLRRDPVIMTIIVNWHWQVAHLCCPDKPVALKEPNNNRNFSTTIHVGCLQRWLNSNICFNSVGQLACGKVPSLGWRNDNLSWLGSVLWVSFSALTLPVGWQPIKTCATTAKVLIRNRWRKTTGIVLSELWFYIPHDTK